MIKKETPELLMYVVKNPVMGLLNELFSIFMHFLFGLRTALKCLKLPLFDIALYNKLLVKTFTYNQASKYEPNNFTMLTFPRQILVSSPDI